LAGVDQAQINQLLSAALTHHQRGELREAEPLYRQMLGAVPNHPDALHLLGVLARQTGHAQAAAELIGRAIAIFPDSAEYHNHLGEALRDLGRTDAAIAEFEAAIRLKPDYAEPHVKIADIYNELDRLQEAEASYATALEIQPDYPEARNNFGNLLRKLGRYAEAEAMFRAVIAARPELPQPHNNLALVLRQMGRLAEAENECLVAIRTAPNYAEVYNNLGNIYFDLRRSDEGIAAFRRAVELKPHSPHSHNNLGTGLEHVGQLDDAVAEYRRAIELAPEFAEAHSNLGSALRQQGLSDQAVATMRKAVELQPNHPLLHSNLLYSLHFDPQIDPTQILDEHQRWGERYGDTLTASRARAHENDRDPDRDPGRPLRVGYVSADFYEHAVGRFLLPLLENIDRAQFQTICYSGVPTPDALSERLRALSDEWHSTIGLGDEALAEVIRSHRIDILIDLSLHSADNRMLVFARKPAPVQISYLGYPSTTGLRAIDWRLTDPHLDPPGNEALYVERSLRLPRTYWCYHPPPAAPAVAPLAALQSGRITFGCLNNFSKLNDRVLACWSSILAQVAGSRLLLHAGEGSHRQRVREFFAAQNVASERIEFLSKVTFGEYLAAHNTIDIALDPFPYTGGTTTCDALWMGCPVVTLAGRSAVQRGGVSLLSNAILSELIASSEAEYVERAVQLAKELPTLAKLRLTMRDRLISSPLLDAPTFARDFEAAFRLSWHGFLTRVDCFRGGEDTG
jgi:predicted O-linked N-acetylglucosamine transferase (SPINDLY family)